MTNIEIYNYYKSMPTGSLEKILERQEILTNHFNSLSVSERKSYIEFLESLPNGKDEVNWLTKITRKQAVVNAWNLERDLILKGKSSRNWTSEQIEQIMNIDSETGMMKKNARAAMEVDSKGQPVLTENGNYKSYIGHHMLDVQYHPEYSGEGGNIQFLTTAEHSSGAHIGGTKLPNYWYYDSQTKSYYLIDDSVEIDFSNVDYIPKSDSIFISDKEMKQIYTFFDDNSVFNDGERLALRNIELSLKDGGDISRFNKALELAEKYNGSSLSSKIGIISNTDLSSKYTFLKNSSDASTAKLFKAYDYLTSRGATADTISFGGTNGLPYDSKLSSMCYGFDNLNDYQKIQMYQAELIYRSSDMSEIQNMLNKYSSETMKGVHVFYDTNGNVVGMDASSIKGATSVKSPGESVFETTIGDMRKFRPDAEMAKLFPDIDFKNLPEIEKLQLRQFDLEYRRANGILDSLEVDNALKSKYLSKVGKTEETAGIFKKWFYVILLKTSDIK